MGEGTWVENTWVKDTGWENSWVEVHGKKQVGGARERGDTWVEDSGWSHMDWDTWIEDT